MELKIQPSEFGIQEKQAEEMTKGLKATLKERELLIDAFEDVSTLEINEENIPIFKELRLKIMKNRTQGIEKWHKANKAFFLAGGRFVDAIKNKEVAINREMEQFLMDGEKYFENQEKERIAKIEKERYDLLCQYMDNPIIPDLGKMDDEVFNAFLGAKKKEWEDRQEELRKQEEERIRKEKLDDLRKERMASIMKYATFWPEKLPDLADMTDIEFNDFANDLHDRKTEYEAEQERIRKENENNRKREEKRQRRSEECKPYLAFIPNLLELLDQPDKKYKEALAMYKSEAEEAWAFQRKQEEARKAEEAEKERKRKEAERLKKASLKERLKAWVDEFSIPETDIDADIAKEIQIKFEAFKKWSNNKIDKL